MSGRYTIRDQHGRALSAGSQTYAELVPLLEIEAEAARLDPDRPRGRTVELVVTLDPPPGAAAGRVDGPGPTVAVHRWLHDPTH